MPSGQHCLPVPAIDQAAQTLKRLRSLHCTAIMLTVAWAPPFLQVVYWCAQIGKPPRESRLQLQKCRADQLKVSEGLAVTA